MSRDQYLYHYTRPEGLKGIVERKTLWATDIRYLNDTQELIEGFELAKEHLRQKKERATRKNQKSRLEWLSAQLELIKPSTFVSSFSTQDDQLSQWRAYCPTGGFAVGFRKDLLKQKAKSQGFELKQCIYDKEKQSKLVGRAIDSKVDSWVRSPGCTGYFGLIGADIYIV